MKKIFLAKLAVLVFSTIALVSCSSSQTEEAVSSMTQTSVPYAFQNIMAGVSPGWPDVEIVIDTEFPILPNKVLVYNVASSLIGDNEASNIASRLGFNGEPAPLDTGSERHIFSYTNGIKRLEISFDGRLRMYSSSNTSSTPILPDEAECISIARKWLIANKLYPAGVTRVETAVYKTIQTVDTNSVEASESVPLSFNVKFFINIGDYEMYSPGASVVIGDNGEVLEATINLLTLEEAGSVILKTPDAALNILQKYIASQEFVPSEAKECLVNLRGFERLVINHVSLSYTYVGDSFVQPIYVFEGIAYSQSSPNGEEFIGRVDAINR